MDMDIDSIERFQMSNEDSIKEKKIFLPSWLPKTKVKSGHLTYMSLRTVIIIPWNPEIIKQPVVASWLGECRCYTIKKLSTGVSAGELVFSNTDTGDVAYLDMKQNLEKIDIQVTHPALCENLVKAHFHAPDYRYKNEFDDIVGPSHTKNFFARLVIVEDLPQHFNTEDMLYQIFPEAESVYSFEYDCFSKGIAILEFESVDARLHFLKNKGPELSIDDDVTVQLDTYTNRCKEYHKYQSYITKQEKNQFVNSVRILDDTERIEFNKTLHDLRNEYENIHNSVVLCGTAKLNRIHEIELNLAKLSAMIRFDNSHRKQNNLQFPEPEDEMQSFTKQILGLNQGTEPSTKKKPKEETSEDKSQLKSLKELEKKRKALEIEYNNNNHKIRKVEKRLTLEQIAERRKNPRESFLPKVDMKEVKKQKEMKLIKKMKQESDQLLQELEFLKAKHVEMKNKSATFRLHGVAEIQKKIDSIPSLMSLKVPGSYDESEMMTEETDTTQQGIDKHSMIEKGSSIHEQEELDYKSLHVTGFLMTPTLKSDLKQLFSRSENIITTKKGGAYGFAFILYETERDCCYEMERNQGMVFNGLPLTIQYKKKNSKLKKIQKPMIKLHITGFPKGMYRGMIARRMKHLCTRTSNVYCNVTKDGIVCIAAYKRENDCKADLQELQGKSLDGNKLKVTYVDEALEERNARLSKVDLPELTGDQQLALSALKSAATESHASNKEEINKTKPHSSSGKNRKVETSGSIAIANPQRPGFTQDDKVSRHRDEFQRGSRISSHHRGMSRNYGTVGTSQTMTNLNETQPRTVEMQPNIVPKSQPFAKLPPSFNNPFNNPSSINTMSRLQVGQVEQPVVPPFMQLPALPSGQSTVSTVGQLQTGLSSVRQASEMQNMVMQTMNNTTKTENAEEVQHLFRGITEVLSAKIWELEQINQQGNLQISEEQIASDLREKLDKILPSN